MSHFTVLVIGENYERQLAPFHEFECTGEDDEYVKDIDITEEIKKNYEKETTKALKDPEGNYHNFYDNKFYKTLILEEGEETEDFIMIDGEKKVHFVPDGYKIVWVPYSESVSFLEFCKDWGDYEAIKEDEKIDYEEHKYGYILLDENNEVKKVIRRTNPNAKWDWYRMGGRWNGFFKLKETQLTEKIKEIEEETGFNSQEIYIISELKKREPEKFEHFMTALKKDKGESITLKIREFVEGDFSIRPIGDCSNFEKEPGKDYTGKADQAYKKEIDIEKMRIEAENKAKLSYEAMEHFFNGNIPKIKTFNELMKDADNKNSADIYNSQEPVLRKFNARKINEDEQLGLSNEQLDEIVFSNLDDFQVPKEKYIKSIRDGAIATFALIKNGVWHERGNMGWWGIVSDEKSKNEWRTQFSKIIDECSDDTLFTIVDCHI